MAHCPADNNGCRRLGSWSFLEIKGSTCCSATSVKAIYPKTSSLAAMDNTGSRAPLNLAQKAKRWGNVASGSALSPMLPSLAYYANTLRRTSLLNMGVRVSTFPVDWKRVKDTLIILAARNRSFRSYEKAVTRVTVVTKGRLPITSRRRSTLYQSILPSDRIGGD